MNDQDIKSRARALIESAVNAVFMTIDNEGFPHPRTMWTAGVDDDFTVYFITGRSLLKIKQIEANPEVCAFWTKTEGDVIGWSYALIKGRATVTDDQNLRDRFWSDMLKEYFPGGKTDPEYVVIVVKPKELMLMDSHKYPLDRITF
ncbi:pyridoxamine 5'-phosphate oxidase family protein [bacterium]|nr:pyridoxamine 5'-phosphate oxidase family protein [bacterium]